ncbi:hypothetical protein E2562_003741 [Oryza meyeriana var. granulata]|uniref:Uncharacterized protein n=1 Tax=Oryza meyeriana var. granulata TaxID=110450 RepID=A0A6G1BRN5_9ORYZ|nr:hypothetical protein E2562_003741 [Oryza meyeriana var. granulata]
MSLPMCKSRSEALLVQLLVCAAAAVVSAGKGNKDGAGRAEVECSDLATEAECVASGSGSRCWWCRSEVLDNMCFDAAKTWRLPNQVFSCDLLAPLAPPTPSDNDAPTATTAVVLLAINLFEARMLC